jgi:hypothetical protein
MSRPDLGVRKDPSRMLGLSLRASCQNETGWGGYGLETTALVEAHREERAMFRPLNCIFFTWIGYYSPEYVDDLLVKVRPLIRSEQSPIRSCRENFRGTQEINRELKLLHIC